MRVIQDVANVPTDLPAVQQRIRGMTLQIEEADATKLRERLDADALNYMYGAPLVASTVVVHICYFSYLPLAPNA